MKIVLVFIMGVLNNTIDGRMYLTTMIISKHLINHTDCIFKESIEDIKTIDILFDTLPSNVRAEPITLVVNGKNKFGIILNSNIKWTEEDITDTTVTILHEWLHYKEYCGDDTKPQAKIICKPFGKPVYSSVEISQAIKKHLNKELNK